MNPLYQRFAATAANTPDALAIQAGDQALTHRQFLALADHQAAAWQALGLGERHTIGWLGHNSPAMLAALLACAKLGAVFVPLNWRLAPAELVTIARHAGLALLDGTPELADLAAQVREGATIGRPGDPQPGIAAGDVLLVYTSGTTGEPKGALHTQHGMVANIDMATVVQGFTAAERVLAVLPLFHVGGLCIQVLPALAAGAVVNLHARFDPGAWLADVVGWRPTTSLLVPAVMQALLAHRGWPAADLASLRFVNSGSSIVPLALIEAFHARGVPMAQVYGSTETGPFSIALAPDEALANVGSVGRPAAGVRLLLAAADGQPVAPGAVGEIQLRAPNLMRCYHRLPAEGPGSGFVDGWYATGDLAHADADGRVTVVGRSKDMLISGGENIYPAEIENIAAAWPGVAEAAVVGLPDARWGEVPVLVLVPQPGATIDLAGLQAQFNKRLARFKHPQRTLLLDSVPRTALGKVQKVELRAALQTALLAGMATDTTRAGGGAVSQSGLVSGGSGG